MATQAMSINITIDQITKLSMNKKSKLIVSKYFENIGLKHMSRELTDNVWEAIKIACHELYPQIEKTSNILTQRQASKVIDNKLSRQTLANKAKAGFIRATEDNQFYEDEIKQIKILLDVSDMMIEQKIILPTQDVSGRDVYAIIPTSITAKGKSNQDQKIEAMYLAFNSPIIQKFLDIYVTNLKTNLKN